jgi:uncharacterized protein (TIGR00255 family)
MTGQGQALVTEEGCTVQAEIRSVNNRFLKVVVRCGDMFNELAPRVERLVQARVRRGMLNVNLKIVAGELDSVYRLNERVLAGYRRQLAEVLGCPPTGDLPPEVWGGLLSLPGVVGDSGSGPEPLERIWPIVEAAVVEAVERLNEMRAMEGQAMATDLTENLRLIAERVREIEWRAPVVSQNYQQRILERIQQWLAAAKLSADASPAAPADVIREVAIFADRCDIAEELVRLRSHLLQFEGLLPEQESQGRKMDFLIQELFREINTVGSKANDAEIAGHVVAVKTCIERMREMVQNVE